MKKLLRAFKTEIHPTAEQKKKINQGIGTCRYIYNMFLAKNKDLYEQDHTYMSGMEFSKWLNNEFIPANADKKWIKETSAKAVKQSIMNADHAFRNFFNKKSRFPKYKKKGINDPKLYFVKNDAKSIIHCERHRIKIPKLGWIRLKEKGYIPTKSIIRSGTVSVRAGRYYVSVLIDVVKNDVTPATNQGLGIDLGLKNFAVLSNQSVFKNINKAAVIRKLEKRLKREQRRLSRKYESLKKRIVNKKGEATRQNICKQKLKVQKLHQRIEQIRTDYVNHCVCGIAKAKPSYITIEDLNIRGMMKNRHLSKAIAGQKFFEFRTKLLAKCKLAAIELRIVDRWYPSSKRCHCCGKVNNKLKLSDRVFRCDCGYEADRDFNASLNLRDAKSYTIAH